MSVKPSWPHLALLGTLWTIAITVWVSTGPAQGSDVQDKRETGYGLIRFEGKGAEFWHYRAVAQTRKLLVERAELHRLERLTAKRFRRDVRYAISLAASVFGVSAHELWVVAGCETGGTYSPFARNRTSDASGLFQFLPSTWRDQGIAGHSVWDPVANALGAARIVAREGWRQWSCKP